jgi:transcriptional regulator with XRE-family HTH domain
MISATDHNAFGQFLQRLRSERRLGMEQAASAAGVHRATLYRWEQGKVLPRLWELDALLKVLEATGQTKAAGAGADGRATRAGGGA